MWESQPWGKGWRTRQGTFGKRAVNVTHGGLMSFPFLMFPGMGNSPPRMESLHHSSSKTSLPSCCLQDQQVVREMLAPSSQPTFLLLSFFSRLYSHTSSLSYLQTPLRHHLPWKPSQTSLVWSQSLLPLRSHSTVCSLDFDTSHMVV